MTEYEGSEDAIDRFFRQGRGEAKPEYPKGKLDADDEGALAFAIAVDEEKKLMMIKFNKPVTWMGLYLPDARRLRDAIGKKIKQLEDLDKPTEPPSPNS